MAKKNLMQSDTNQLSFFDIIDKAPERPLNAFSLLTNNLYPLHELEPWMTTILPQGEFYVFCAGHPLVLCSSSEKIEPEMLYRHYKVGNKIYVATAVGRDKDIVKKADACDKELPDTSNPVLYEITNDKARLLRSVIRKADGNFTGMEYGFESGFDKNTIAELLKTNTFLNFWNQKAKEINASVFVYNNLNKQEARSFIKMGKYPYINDMTNSFSSYFTKKSFSSTFVLDFEKNI